MLPYGVASGEEYLSGIGTFRKTETCNVAASIWSTLWMYRILGEGGYGDAIERAFFNAGAPRCPRLQDHVLLPVAQPPPLGQLALRTAPMPRPGPHSFPSPRCPHVLCCVGTVNRIVPNYIMHMWMATGDQGLAAACTGHARVSAIAGQGVPVKLACTTAYPFEETIRVTGRAAAQGILPFVLPHPRLVLQSERFRSTALRGCAPGSERVPADRAGVVPGRPDRTTLPMAVRGPRDYETEFPAASRSISLSNQPRFSRNGGCPTQA